MKKESGIKLLKNLSDDPVKRRRQIIKAVIKCILEEPKRFNWMEWLYVKEPRISNHGFSLLAHGAPGLAPTCGTVGCVAGWIAVLTRGTDSYQHVPEIASEELGISPGSVAAVSLFSGYRHCSVGVGPSGTEHHATVAAAYIKEWLKRVEAGKLNTSE